MAASSSKALNPMLGLKQQCHGFRLRARGEHRRWFDMLSKSIDHHDSPASSKLTS
jgi:hypothetical protein